MRVVVVGGGLAGLFTAWCLVDRGIDEVVVLEAGDRPGGLTQTMETGGYLLEPAVGSMSLPHPDLTPILEGIGAKTVPAGESVAGRYLWTGESLVALEPGPGLLFSPLGSWGARARALVEPLVREPAPGGDESLDSFLTRRLGRGLGPVVSWLAASGVFAGDPASLSARAAFPTLVGMVDESGSLSRAAVTALRRRRRDRSGRRTHLPERSMTALAENAAGVIGSRFLSGHQVESVRRTGRGWVLEGDITLETEMVVLACGPVVSSSLLAGPIAESLAQARSAPVTVVWLGAPEPDIPLPDGYGILIGRESGMATRGVLLESSYAPHRAPEGHRLVKVIAGGHPDSGITDLDDRGVTDRVVSEVSRIAGSDLSPTLTAVVRHRPGIPQYGVGHREWLDHLERVAPQGLFLTGWGYRGVGLAQLATDAVRVASQMAG